MLTFIPWLRAEVAKINPDTVVPEAYRGPSRHKLGVVTDPELKRLVGVLGVLKNKMGELQAGIESHLATKGTDESCPADCPGCQMSQEFTLLAARVTLLYRLIQFEVQSTLSWEALWEATAGTGVLRLVINENWMIVAEPPMGLPVGVYIFQQPNPLWN